MHLMQDSAVNPQPAPQYTWSACDVFTGKHVCVSRESTLEAQHMLEQLKEAGTILTLRGPPHCRPQGLG